VFAVDATYASVALLGDSLREAELMCRRTRPCTSAAVGSRRLASRGSGAGQAGQGGVGQRTA
jgi:hypothetical protein